MSRSQRLFDLLQLLRRHKYPLAARHMAQELGVSARTIYRDVVTLQAQGADIEGEAGLGYVLKPNFMLPPLMFSMEELEVLLLGAEWAAKQAGGEFGATAKNAIAKIAAVLPADHRAKVDDAIMRVGPMPAAPESTIAISEIRDAIKQQLKCAIDYTDAQGNRTARVVWPILIGFFQQCHVLVAWCEKRAGFRHFRLDRILSFTPGADRYPGFRKALLKSWRQEQGLAEERLAY
ncbi:MAG TPA: transcriptional regulator [Janthinobacterium sp.]|nr:transcriptional regulator [Janthinobacterium sp.]